MLHNWVDLEDVVFDDNIEILNVDTRDFHCLSISKLDYDQTFVNSITQLTSSFVYTIQQIRELLFLLREESGGIAEWRMLSFTNDKLSTGMWGWKYIMVYKVTTGYGVCLNSNDCKRAWIKRSFFKHHKIEQEYLNTH